MKKKTLGIIIVSVLGAAAIFCSAMFTHQYLDAKNSKAAFDDLTNLITEIDEPQKDTEAEEADLSAEELAAAEAALAREKYAALFAQNNDFIGWIKIDGTNVNYPVMQTPNKPDFYLKRSFDKSYSDYGVPYIDEACMTGISNNLVIYGHHMNDGSMFNVISDTTDQATFDSMEYVYYITRDATYKLRPLATKVVEDTYAKARTPNFEGDDGLKNYLSEMLDGASAVASDATNRAASATKVVTLVTCRSLSFSNTRAVMVLTPVEE